MKQHLEKNGFDYDKTIDSKNPALLKKKGVLVKIDGTEVSMLESSSSEKNVETK